MAINEVSAMVHTLAGGKTVRPDPTKRDPFGTPSSIVMGLGQLMSESSDDTVDIEG